MPKITKVDVPPGLKKRKRVAAYARVSKENDKTFGSLSAQISYYSSYIQKNPEWEYAGVYADDGISGTGTKHRSEFRRLIDDCEAGKVDIVLTKSISRFARNTVDLLETVRHLKDLGVEVRFEKENIWTLDAKGELLITIMSSLAQEESRSISENVIWGHRKRFADGKVSFTYSRFMGLDKDPETGNIVVNKEEAKIVKLIFGMFMEGLTPNAIANELTRLGITPPGGGDRWWAGTVQRMLQNEKYKGDALLQKNVTVDFLSHKLKKNEGEAPQYYVEGNHEAIIDPKVFELVQAEIGRRKKGKSRYSGVSIFSSKIKCGDCGEWYGAKVWHSTDRYRKVIYRSNHKYADGHKCETPHVTEDEIKDAFIRAFNEISKDKDETIRNIHEMKSLMCMTDDLVKEKEHLAGEMAVVAEMTHDAIAENARVAQDQTEYKKRYAGLVERYDGIKERYDEVIAAIKDKEATVIRLDEFVKALKSQDGVLTEFNEELWGSMVDHITVGREKELAVRFKDGTEIVIQG